MLNSRDINLLRPDVAAVCRKVMELAKASGIPILITSTVRDDEYQASLYAQGRTKPGAIVTNVQYTTFHGAGLAFDFCPTDEVGNCLWDRPDLFRAVGEIGESLGLEWGGRWTGLVDMPHLQWSGPKHELTGADIRAGKRPPMLILEEGKPMTVEEAKKIIKEKAGLTDETMLYLSWYKFGDTLLIKLAETIKK
jgi:hypothetical protein